MCKLHGGWSFCNWVKYGWSDCSFIDATSPVEPQRSSCVTDENRWAVCEWEEGLIRSCLWEEDVMKPMAVCYWPSNVTSHCSYSSANPLILNDCTWKQNQEEISDNSYLLQRGTYALCDVEIGHWGYCEMMTPPDFKCTYGFRNITNKACESLNFHEERCLSGEIDCGMYGVDEKINYVLCLDPYNGTVGWCEKEQPHCLWASAGKLHLLTILLKGFYLPLKICFLFFQSMPVVVMMTVMVNVNQMRDAMSEGIWQVNLDD